MVAHLLETCTDLACWDSELGSPNGTHFNGHASIGLDMFDAYSSPVDPSFWLHHAQVDRMWTIWQNKESQAARTLMTSGTETPLNSKFSFGCSLFVRAPVLKETKCSCGGGFEGLNEFGG